MLRFTGDPARYWNASRHLLMARWWRRGAWFLVVLVLPVACESANDQPAATPTTSSLASEASAVPATAASEESAAEGVEAAPARTYQRFPAPLIARSETAAATLSVTEAGTVEGETGEFRIAFGEGALADAIVVSREGQPTGMALRPLGPELNLLANATAVEMLDEEGETGVRLAGTGPLGPFEMRLWVYPNNPGLLRYRVDVEPSDELPSGATALEWQFVDPTTGEEAPRRPDHPGRTGDVCRPLRYTPTPPRWTPRCYTGSTLPAEPLYRSHPLRSLQHSGAAGTNVRATT
jgi:hypothetical protein